MYQEDLQITELHPKYDTLQQKYGDPNLKAIYGAGKVKDPSIMFVFMNPTARNVSCFPHWEGIRAPWLGTKSVWAIFHSLSLISDKFYKEIKLRKPNEWDPSFALNLYRDISEKDIFITNLAKCTLPDARPLKNSVYKEYLQLMLEEISQINPKKIITFGNQVSSIILNKPISVSNYENEMSETVLVGESTYETYPVYYPVGQGRRNLPLALNRISYIINN